MQYFILPAAPISVVEPSAIGGEATSAMHSCQLRTVFLAVVMLLFILKPGISKTNVAIKSEIKDILKEQNIKAYTIKESKSDESKNYKLENIKDTIKDPYDQIKSFVEAQDTAYFNQLRAFTLTKDSATQVKDKAVVYAILQDTALTENQKQVLALAYFERLARMPGTEFRFTRRSSALTVNDPKYKERSQRYIAYRSYLD